MFRLIKNTLIGALCFGLCTLAFASNYETSKSNMHTRDLTNVGSITMNTGESLTVGSTQWDNGSDAIDGESIANDTIDDDSIDFSDVTGADLTLTDANAVSCTQLTVNDAGADIDTRIEGGTDANLFYTDAGLNCIYSGASTNYNTENYSGVGFNAKFQVANSGNGCIAASQWTTTAGYGATMHLSRSNNAAVGTYTALDTGDCIGEVGFFSADGAGFEPAANIVALADGAQGADDVPARIEFRTTADGAALPTKHLTIDSTGGIFAYNLKSGTDQANAGAAADELYIDTDNNSIKIGV